MTQPKRIQVVVADDHPIFLHGVRNLLEKNPSVSVVGEAHDGVTAWQLIQTKKPKLAILDMDMPGMDGIQIARRVKLHKFPVSLIMLTMHRNEDLFREALELGVLNYLLKDDMAADLDQCIKAVAAGNHFISPALSSTLVRSRLGAKATGGQTGVENLSPAQREVLKLVARGLSSKEIAAELGISHRTVENHRARIAERIGLKGSHSLVRFALSRRTEL